MLLSWELHFLLALGALLLPLTLQMPEPPKPSAATTGHHCCCRCHQRVEELASPCAARISSRSRDGMQTASTPPTFPSCASTFQCPGLTRGKGVWETVLGGLQHHTMVLTKQRAQSEWISDKMTRTVAFRPWTLVLVKFQTQLCAHEHII